MKINDNAYENAYEQDLKKVTEEVSKVMPLKSFKMNVNHEVLIRRLPSFLEVNP